MREVSSEHEASRTAHRTFLLAFASLVLAFAAFLLPALETAPAGGLVGWILFLAGVVEFAFGASLGGHRAARTAFGGGLITLIAGGLFIIDPLAGFSPVANIVLLWLLARASWLLFSAFRSQSRARSWIALTGAVDLVLAIALLIGLQIGALAVALFGPTPEMVGRFAWILAISLLTTSISQAAIALLYRKGRE